MATDCIAQTTFQFHPNSKPVIARFDVEHASSDGGAVLLNAHWQRLHGRARRIIIDLDQTDDPTHGQQEFAFFHGYYDAWCYLPLVATLTFNDEAAQYLVATWLRPGRDVPSTGAVALLRRLLPKLRAVFPRATLCVRLDAGFAGNRLLAFLEAQGLEYVVGLQGNRRLDRRVQRLQGRARARARVTGESVRLFGETRYAAKGWARKRRIIMKAAVVQHPGRPAKSNPRFVVTNLSHAPALVYAFYCGRGDVENRLKELHHGLEMDRTSCSRFVANQFRVLLTAAAYVLFQELQRRAAGTGCADAQVTTLRERLIKIGVWIERSVRRIVLHLPATFPWRRSWWQLARAVGATP